MTLVVGCASSTRWAAPRTRPDDRVSIPEPKPRAYDVAEDSFDKQAMMPLERRLDLSRQLRALAGRPKQAFNTDAFDEVADSAWFTNRNARHKLSGAEIERGPNTVDGPDTSTVWTVVRAKTEGVTPGFAIQDSRGDRYFIKFDPPGRPEMSSGADVVCTKLFWAAGFHVAEDYVTVFDPQRLRLGSKVKFTDKHGRTRPLVQADLDAILAGVERRADGRIRALASRSLPGKVLGPFSYDGTRRDDPNDLVPHEHRRELRGLRVMAAWLHHFDTKDGNSLDTWIDDHGRRYIRHYLLDFSSTLGSGSNHSIEPYIGHQNAVDPNDSFARLVTLGLHVEPWEKLRPAPWPALGYFESATFDPAGYEFYIPNPAFANCTGRDGFWGAKLVLSFTDEQIAAAVGTGQYSDPEAARALVKILIERRDKTGRTWLARVNPLDRFALAGSGDGLELQWTDLAVEHGFEAARATRYRCALFAGGKALQPSQVATEPRFARFPVGATQTPDQLELRIATARRDGGAWSPLVHVYLDRDPHAAAGWRLAGIERQD